MNFLTIFLELTTGHILLILAVFLLLFGGKKIPELMKGLGTGLKEFKNASKDEQPANSKKEEETKE
jgi:sec-independent protein translocase protein TatA